MSIRAVVRTTHAGRHILECGIEEEFEVAADAFARLDELKPMLGIGGPVPIPGPVTVAAKHWSREELDVIAGAKTRREALQMYRAALPHMDRSDAGIIKQYRKLTLTPIDVAVCRACGIPRPAESIDEHGMCTVCEAIANGKDEQAIEGAAAPVPVSAGDEVTLHEPVEDVPEQEPIKKKAYKNAWTPEEDEIIRKAETLEEAIRNHGGAFPGKRTGGAIGARWRSFNPSTLQKLKEIAASKPELPERGAIVSIAEDMGRIRTGQTGKVIRRDTIVGEVLVDFGAGNGGCVWMAPEKVAVVSE